MKEVVGTLMIGETRDPKHTSLVEPGTQELWTKWTKIKRTINRIWVIIFLIFNHIIKRLQLCSKYVLFLLQQGWFIYTPYIHTYIYNIYIYIYVLLYTFLGNIINICTHLPFVFWRQTNFAKFSINHLCQSLFFH